ncbi:MAG: single-stranded DNA-binding protein [Bacteroidia bacterium]|jgi:single-strand DNA-binding protein|nr:single-stranded DNA-binding protein [Bacteroidia bacterium]MCO5253153.1 single-stranded DNA-binding protein [Bacteroidota bacterium]MCZ2128764.1 single-stranded DNA-binding protein [Bacteroidia bacterium]
MINKVILVGRVGKDLELRTLNRGTQIRFVVNFPFATHEFSVNRKTGERLEQVEWHNIEMWDKNAENAAKILKKGRVVYIEGRIKCDVSTDSDGNKQYRTKIRASLFQVLNFNGNNTKSQLEGEAKCDEMNEDIEPIDNIMGTEDFDNEE